MREMVGPSGRALVPGQSPVRRQGARGTRAYHWKRSSEDDSRPRQFRTRHGNVSTMNTADIGAKQPTEKRDVPYRGPTTTSPPSTERVFNQEIKRSPTCGTCRPTSAMRR